MIEIIPAILPRSSEDLESALDSLNDSTFYVHLDVLERDVWSEIDAEFEVHLMVDDPEVLMCRWVDRGAKRIIVHQLNEDILTHRGIVEIGLGVALDTPLSNLLDLVNHVDFLHLMSIAEMGEQGHAFDRRIFDRIKEVRRMFGDIVISIDGGITLEKADELIADGIDRLIIGSAIFGKDNPEREYKKFLELAN
ncbi:MAG: hypothetical protein ABIF06_01795 [bacterium]